MALRYNINENGKILVWVISQTFPLGDANQKDKWKKMEKDEYGYKQDIDYKKLESFFENGERFPAKIEFKSVLTNQTYAEFQKEVKQLDEDEDETEYQAFIFVFLTYGHHPKNIKMENNEEILHFDCKKQETGLVPQAKIIDEVKNLKVTRGKPKVFLFQADDLSLLEPIEKDKVGPIVPAPPKKIPRDSDQLIIKSTIPQRVINDKSQPSFLIQAFLEAMKDNYGTDVFTLTTTINGIVNGYIEKEKPNREGKPDLCLPLVTSTLTKLLYLS